MALQDPRPIKRENLLCESVDWWKNLGQARCSKPTCWCGTSSARKTCLEPPKFLNESCGGGFVSSASHPELAARYGNVATRIPFTDSSKPGTAEIDRVEKQPISGMLNLKKLPEVADSTQCKSQSSCWYRLKSSFTTTVVWVYQMKWLQEVWCCVKDALISLSAGQSNTIGWNQSKVNIWKKTCITCWLRKILYTESEESTIRWCGWNITNGEPFFIRIIIAVVQNKDLALSALTVFARILSLPMIHDCCKPFYDTSASVERGII